MVKTMHSCLAFCLILLSAGQTPAPVIVGPGGVDQHLQVHCAINSILVADELMNSIIFIWQGVNRCGKGHKAAECSVDISNAIQSVTGMINVILKAVATCGDSFNLKVACGAAVTQVTGSMAGVAATASGIAEHCPKTSIKPIPGLVQQSTGVGGATFDHGLAYCIVDSKNLVKSVLRLSVRIADASEMCKGANAGGNTCGLFGITAGILGVLGAVGEMGEFIAGVVGHCSKPENQPAACASEVLGLLRNLAELSQAGTIMGNVCELSADERLYLDNARGGVEAPDNTNSNLPTSALVALLPMTAVLSFVAGRRIAKFHRAPAADPEMASVE